MPVDGGAKGIKETLIPVEKIIIEKVMVNPLFTESVFWKPDVGTTTSGQAKAVAGRR